MKTPSRLQVGIRREEQGRLKDEKVHHIKTECRCRHLEMDLPKRQYDVGNGFDGFCRLMDRLYEANSYSSKTISSQFFCRATGVFGASVSIKFVV